MKISLSSIGGFAGPAAPEKHELDLAQLPADDAAPVLALLADADFFALPATLLKSAPKSWDFLHEMRVEDGARSHSVRFHEDAIAAAEFQALRQLFELVRGRAV